VHPRHVLLDVVRKVRVLAAEAAAARRGERRVLLRAGHALHPIERVLAPVRGQRRAQREQHNRPQLRVGRQAEHRRHPREAARRDQRVGREQRVAALHHHDRLELPPARARAEAALGEPRRESLHDDRLLVPLAVAPGWSNTQ